MCPLAERMEHQIPAIQAKAPINQGRLPAHWKRDDGLSRRQCEEPDARKTLSTPKHLQSTQVQPRQLTFELSPRSDEEIDARSSNRCAVVIRTSKSSGAARCHADISFDAPGHPGLSWLSAQDARLAAIRLCDFGSWTPRLSQPERSSISARS